MNSLQKNNLKWWGDAVSGRFLSGINKNHKKNKKLTKNISMIET